MRSIAFLVAAVGLAGAVRPAAAGEVHSWFCQTGLIAPLERAAYQVDLASADIHIRLPRPPPASAGLGPAHIRATYELRNRYEQATPLLIAFPMSGGVVGYGDPKVNLKINGQPAGNAFYESQYLFLQFKKRNIDRWIEAHPEVAKRIDQVPPRQGDERAFQTARRDLERWLDREMGLSQVDAHTLVELAVPQVHPSDLTLRMGALTPWPRPMWAPYTSLREAINLRWRNEELFVNLDSARLVECYEPVGAGAETSLVVFRHTIPPNGKALILLDYSAHMGRDDLTKTKQLQFALAQVKYWGPGYRYHDEVKVEIDVPRGWRKVRIRPAMDMVRSTSRSRIYHASFTRPREDIYIALAR